MKRANLWIAFGLIILLPCFFLGCASSSDQRVADPKRPDYPNWFFQEGGVFKDEATNQVVYAVGTARQGPNLATTRDMARNNGRVEIGRILGAHIQSMITQYAQRAGDYYQPETFSDTENFENISRNLSEAYISGSYVIDSFFADFDNSFAVLMRLDLEMSDLLSRVKSAVRENYAAKMKEKTEAALNAMDDAFATQDQRLRGSPSEFSEAKKAPQQ